jgi:hypothetical protein
MGNYGPGGFGFGSGSATLVSIVPEMYVLWVQCVDRRLKAADQLLYTEEEGMLHVALIAANVKRSVQIYS